jgi:hypothetical protein
MRGGSDAWVAVDPASDRLTHARALRRIHEAFNAGTDISGRVRAVVAQSWERSDAAGIDPQRHLAPILMDEREIEARWHAHPLYPVLPVLRQLLSDATTRAGHMLVISDAQGVLLWLEGHHGVIDATENMHFVCGADWSETGAGTNALGTALAVDHPVQIFSAEHFNRIVHPWQCSGAPIHDPDTGEVVGVIDLTGHLKTAHPHTLSLVTAAAGMAEAYLREEQSRRDERLRERFLDRLVRRGGPGALVAPSGRVVMSVPHDWVGGRIDALPRQGGEVDLGNDRAATAEPVAGGDAMLLWPLSRTSAKGTVPRDVPRSAIRFELLGRPPALHTWGEESTLSRRHAEIVALLAINPRGLTSEQLALELYGKDGKSVTVRAELSRLRTVLGDALEARPYRLTAGVEVDFIAVERLLDEGDIAQALALYTDALLPDSDVDVIVERRRRLDALLRRAVMTSGDIKLLLAWCSSGSGSEDVQAAELLFSLVDDDDPAEPIARAHLARLRRLDFNPP